MNVSRTLFLAFAFCATFAQADVVNGNFEDPALTAGQYNTTLPGWEGNGASNGVWHLPTGGFFETTAPEGLQIGYSNSLHLAQQLTDTIGEGDNTISVYGGRRHDGFAGSFTLQLIAGGSVVNGNNTTGTVLATLTYDYTQYNPDTFTWLEGTYTANAGDAAIGQQVTLLFTKTAGSQMDFDDVRFSSVPEPATLTLLALVPLALRRKSRKAN